MPFRHDKFENYDKESKGKLRSIMRASLVALTVLLGLILLCAALTGAGVFPGNIVNRFVVSSYLDGHYDDYKIVSYAGYNSENKSYVYNCIVNGSPCTMSAYNLRVNYDGYFHEYGRNKYFEGIVQNYLDSLLDGKWSDGDPQNNTASWKTEIEIPLSDNSYPSSADMTDADSAVSSDYAESDMIESALKAYDGSLRFNLDIRGDAVSMDEHKKLVYKAVRIIQLEMYNRPQELTVHYYRNENGSYIMQYESTVRTFQFNYNESGILNASDIHKYTEIPEELETKVHIYYIVKFIFLIFLSVTVVSLSALWIVRRIKKYRRARGKG